MAQESLKQFMQRFMEGISSAFPSAASSPSPEPQVAPSAARKTTFNPVADKLFKDSFAMDTPVSSVGASPEDEDFSSVIKRALASDGVITLRGDKASVAKKPKVKGGFSKMPSKSEDSSSVPDIIKISQSMASGEGLDPVESSKIVKQLTKHIKDPKERQRQEMVLAWATGDEAGKAIANKKEKELSGLQAQSIRRNLDQADIAEAALTGDPVDKIRAIVRFRKGGKEKKPIVDPSELPSFFEPERQGFAKTMESVLGDDILSLFSPQPGTLTKKGMGMQERLKTISGAPVDTVEEFYQLLQALIEAEDESR